jgi:glycolate oxidase FAD binding subunit
VTLELLEQAAGMAREAGPADTVGGRAARFVATPGRPEQLAAVLARCTAEGLTAVARGDGSKLDWGTPPSTVDVLVDTARLAGVPEHPEGELVVTVGAGTPLRALQALLGRSGERLALDPPSPEATVGGVLATGEAGPLAHTYGFPRDLLIGVQFARADGTLARSGGKVVKNVAGYDLGKLLCGSYGTLGVLTSATFRLHPVPVARAWLLRPVHRPAEVVDLAAALMASPLAPTAVEVDLPPSSGSPVPRQRGGSEPVGPAMLAVLFEGSALGVPARCHAAAELLGHESDELSIVDEQPAWWGRYPFGAGDVGLRLTVPPAQLAITVALLRDAAGVPVPVRGSAGIGVLYAALPGDLPVPRLAEILATVRAGLADRDGWCVAVCAPGPARTEVDLWGPAPGLPLMRRVKEQFDPRRLLAPGRFVGGI